MSYERHFCLDNSPTFRMMELDEVSSTNDFLKHYRNAGGVKYQLVTAEYQVAGRGAGQNKWESERSKNLLFSLSVLPKGIPASEMFRISEIISLAVCNALNEYQSGFLIKWPNDIYYKDYKVAGILIENDLSGKVILRSIIGVGVNVNQKAFLSDAPNPYSLAQIIGKETERRFVLEKIIEYFISYLEELENGVGENIHKQYLKKLYRQNEWHLFSDENGTFRALIHDVERTGHLVLKCEGGELRKYAFKEVQYII